MELLCSQWNERDQWSTPLPDFDGVRTLVTVFAGADADRCAPGLAAVAAAYPTSIVVGCSTAGEIFGELVFDDTVTVAVTRFAEARVQVACVQVPDVHTSKSAGVALARELGEADPELAAIFVLSDGLAVNGSSLVAGLVEGSRPEVAVTGGLAGDGDSFGSTWVLVDGEPRKGWVTAVGLSGPGLSVRHGSQGGWDPFGPERRITRSEGNVLHELDGQPALDLYKTYLGERADELPGAALLFPLAVRSPEGDDRRLVRTVLAVDEVTQTMTFAGDLPEGSLAQLMRANFDRLVDGASDAARATNCGDLGDGPTLALAISCVGRRLVLKGRTEDELEAALAGLPEATELIGFYSYGEISPYASGNCDLQNQTMTVTTIRESAAA